MVRRLNDAPGVMPMEDAALILEEKMDSDAMLRSIVQEAGRQEDRLQAELRARQDTVNDAGNFLRQQRKNREDWTPKSRHNQIFRAFSTRYASESFRAAGPPRMPA